MTRPAMGVRSQGCDANRAQILRSVGVFALKITVFLLVAWALLTWVFGIERCDGAGMSPAVHDGDVAVFYRLQGDYERGDVVVVNAPGRAVEPLRIAACPGDVVEICEQGVKVNGYLQQEPQVVEETLLPAYAAQGEIALGENEYYVLGDGRMHASDSREFGPVCADEKEGIVVGLMRLRGF